MNMKPVIHETGWMADCPMWDQQLDPRLPVRALSDLISQIDWQAHPLYAEVLVEDGMMDHLTLEFGDRLEDYFTVNATRSKRGFHSRDREMLVMLRPHFVQAFANAAKAEEAGISRLSPSADTLFPITPAGQLAALSEAQRDLLHFHFQSRGRVPDPVCEWMGHQVRRLNQGLRNRAILPCEYRQGGEVYEFTLLRDWRQENYLLSLRQVRLPAKFPELSPRETEILQWVSEGKTNEETAIILGIGPETVKTHLRRCYQKLGVSNRIGAVCAWRERG